jgi:DNA modification methylase
MLNKIINGVVPDALYPMADETFQTCITSPPYWGLRDYGLEPVVWDAPSGCDHDWNSDGGCPTKIGKYGSTETIKNPTLVASMQKCEHEWGIEGPEFHKGQVPQTKWQGVDAVANGGNAKSGSFCHKCGAWLGCLGLEPTPELYISHLVQIFREVKRVLRKDGTCWVNIGDSYAGAPSGSQTYEGWWHTGGIKSVKGSYVPRNTAVGGLKPKDMVLIPFRLALALQADGWWIRSDIIWHKPNCMPSSAKDRPTTDFEHVFLLAKSKKYYYDQEAIREPMTEATRARDKYGFSGAFKGQFNGTPGEERWQNGRPIDSSKFYNAAGRNKRTVWTIPTKPYPEAHFATFPPELIEPMILAGSSDKACLHCGAAWVRIVERQSNWQERKANGATAGNIGVADDYQNSVHGKGMSHDLSSTSRTIGFQPSCTCEDNDGSGASIVLDPFAGSGTTCAVAKAHGRHWIGIEANPEYCELARKRIEQTETQLELSYRIELKDVGEL